MRIAMIPFDPKLGAFDSNVERALALVDEAAQNGADLAVLPLGALCGLPIEGLDQSLLFEDLARDALDGFAARAAIPCIVSSLVGPDDAEETLIAMEQYGIPEGVVDVELLAARPDVYHVRDGRAGCLHLDAFPEGVAVAIEVGGVRIGVCQPGRVDTSALDKPVDALIAPRALPYNASGVSLVEDPGFFGLYQHAVEEGLPFVTVNLLGGQDSNVFDGACYAVAPGGRVVTGQRFSDAIAYVELDELLTAADPMLDESLVEVEKVALDWQALVLATRDYVRKNGNSDVLIGLSGGLDSTLVATIAADALGPEHVHGLLMPGPFSSEGSVADATQLAANLGFETFTVPITPALEALEATLAEACGGQLDGLAHENTQARIRMVELYAVSNSHGWMVLNTGNKSESAMGFSTIYGDTCGAFAPLGDLYKMDCYDLARWRNSQPDAPIPPACITKPPSAELHAGQRDSDRLPPYELLDRVLLMHVEGGYEGGEIIASGLDEALVKRVLPTVQRMEFKRRVEPLYPAISECSFAQRGWPVTNGFSDPCELYDELGDDESGNVIGIDEYR